MRVQRGGRTCDGLGQQRSGTGFAQQVEVIITGRAVGAYRHIDAGLPQALHRTKTTGQFEVGLRAMHHSAIMFHQQGDIGLVDLGHVHRLKARAQQTQASQAGQWPLAGLLKGLLHFEGCLVDVHVNSDVHFVGQLANFLQVFVVDGVRCVGPERNTDPRMMAHVAEQLDAQVQCLIGAARARDLEVQHRHGDLRAHAAEIDPLARHSRIEIHVREAGNAAQQLFGDGQVRAVGDEVLIHPAALGWPDMVCQPSHQR